MFAVRSELTKKDFVVES